MSLPGFQRQCRPKASSDRTTSTPIVHGMDAHEGWSPSVPVPQRASAQASQLSSAQASQRPSESAHHWILPLTRHQDSASTRQHHWTSPSSIFPPTDGVNPLKDLVLSYGVTSLAGGEGPVRFRGPNMYARRYRRKTGEPEEEAFSSTTPLNARRRTHEPSNLILFDADHLSSAME